MVINYSKHVAIQKFDSFLKGLHVFNGQTEKIPKT